MSNELLNLKTISRSEKNIYQNSVEEQYAELDKENEQSIETITTEDPNMKNNPPSCRSFSYRKF